MPGQYQEGQRLQGSDGKVYVVQGGVPRQEIAPQQAGPPAFIPGTPDPHRGSEEQRKIKDQRMQEDKFAFDRQQAEAKAAKDEADRAAGVGIAARESEAKASAFLLRALGANDSYEAQKIGPRSLPGQAISDTFPNALNSLPEAIGNSPRRQVADSNQDEFIAASLRQDSGAAIPTEEMDRQRRIYFPTPGESQDAIAAKRAARARAIAGLEQSSGKLRDQTIAKWNTMAKGTQAPEAESLFGGGDAGMTGSVTDTSTSSTPPLGGGNAPDPSGISVNRDMLYGDPSGMAGLRELGAQGISLGLSDEAAGIGGYLSALLTGGNPSEAYTANRDADRAFLGKARKAWGGAGTAMEFLGGGGAARIAPGINSLAQYAKQGAGVGAAVGYGYGEGAGGSLAGAGVGAGVGAGLGVALPVAGNAIARLRKPGPPVDMDVIAAAGRQRVPLRQPDARPELRGEYGAVEATEKGGPMIRGAIADDAAAIERRVAEVGGPGTARDNYSGGGSVQNALDRQKTTAKAANRVNYERVEKLAPGAVVPPSQTLAAIDARIAELQASGPGASKAEVEVLRGIKDDLAQTGLSVKSLQAQRKGLRTRLNQAGMDYNAEQANFAGILDTAGMELQGGLNSINPAAGKALARADTAYAEFRTFRDTVAKEFVGTAKTPVSAETASQRLISMAQAKGNHDKYAAMWNALDKAERADISATIAASLGRKGNGEFSVATLVGSLDPAKGINPRTAQLVFGKDGAAALNDLRAIANAKTAAGSERNYSASGKVLNRTAGGLRNLIFGALGMSAGGPAGIVAAPLAGQFFRNWGEARAARMLLNPDFTKALRNAPNSANPKVIDAYFARLASIPSIAANDNAAFVKAFRDSFAASPGPAAAEQETDTRRIPPQ